MATASGTGHVLDVRAIGLRLCGLAFGVVVAGALTWLMYILIESGNERLNESDRVHFTDFIRVKQAEQTRTRERAPEKIAPSKAPPVPQAAQSEQAADSNFLTVADIAIDTQIADTSRSTLGFGGGDGEYLPIVKVAPVYPMAAKARKIEGDCIVQYTVTTTGTVQDVVVLEDQCINEAFYKPSINAALKFKYKPRVIDGTAVEVHGVKNRFVYKLERGE